MSEYNYDDLNEIQQQYLARVGHGNAGEFMHQGSIDSLVHKGLIVWVAKYFGAVDDENDGYELTVAGRAVLAQADSAKPPVIDAATFANEHYDSKIANGECIVRDGYGDIVRNVKLTICIMSGTYRVTEQDGCDYLMHRSSSANKFTVTWVPQADSAKPEAGNDTAENLHNEWIAEKIRFQDRFTELMGNCQSYEDQIATLRSDLAAAREQVARLRAAACKAEALRQIWLKKSEVVNAAYDVLQASDKPYDARTKAYKDHDTLSKDSQRALWRFQDAIRNIGQSVWQEYLADQRKQAVLAGDEGGA